MYSLKWVRSALDNKYQNEENKSIFTDTVSWHFVGVHFYSTALNIFLYMLTRASKETVNYTSEQKILRISFCLVKLLKFAPNAKISVLLQFLPVSFQPFSW